MFYVSTKVLLQLCLFQDQLNHVFVIKGFYLPEFVRFDVYLSFRWICGFFMFTLHPHLLIFNITETNVLDKP